MKKAIFRSGVFSGLLMSAFMAGTMPIVDKIGYSNAELLGYLGMIIGFMPIFFGVRKFRDKENNGAIAFGRAASMAMLAALVAGLFYVATWLIIYYSQPDMMTNMAAHAMAQLKAAGRSQQEIDAAMKQMQNMMDMYKNPFVNAAITFTEPLPVALIFSLITALIIKKQPALPLQQN
jgi:hypothetical protein